MQTPYWLFTCFAQCSLNNEIIDCSGNLLITKQNDCKRKARAKFRSGPHWEVGSDLQFRQRLRWAGMRTGAPTQRLHKPLACIIKNHETQFTIFSIAISSTFDCQNGDFMKLLTCMMARKINI